MREILSATAERTLLEVTRENLPIGREGQSLIATHAVVSTADRPGNNCGLMLCRQRAEIMLRFQGAARTGFCKIETKARRKHFREDDQSAGRRLRLGQHLIDLLEVGGRVLPCGVELNDRQI